MTATPAGTDTRVRIVRSIRDVDAAAWDALAGSNPLLRHGWLRTMEAEWTAELERVYFLLESGGRLAGAAACYVDDAGGNAESVDDLLFGRLRGYGCPEKTGDALRDSRLRRSRQRGQRPHLFQLGLLLAD